MKLAVDGKSIRMNTFVTQLFSNTLKAVLDSLHDIPENPEKVILNSKSDSEITLEVNDLPIRTKAFVSRMLRRTFLGMVSSLGDVPDNPGVINISTEVT